jgi:hypothetical protein
MGQHEPKAIAEQLLIDVVLGRQRMLDPYVLPWHIEFLRYEHRKRRLDALPHLSARHGHRDDAVFADLHVGIERVLTWSKVLQQWIGAGLVQPITDDESSTDNDGRSDQKVAPAGAHHLPLSAVFISFQAAFTASRMREYVPQRHKLPASAASISSSLGSRPWRRKASSSATVVMIWPDWQ